MVQDGKKMSIAALIVAAGRGTRAGGNDPKQWQMLAGKRVIDHTLNAFKQHRNIDTILVVLHPKIKIGSSIRRLKPRLAAQPAINLFTMACALCAPLRQNRF